MRKIYLVDDDRLILEQLCRRRRLFAECGFEICGTATNPLTALDEIRALRPDAVISDLKMPELSGTGLLEKLKTDIFCPLFVIVSAYNEFKDVRKLFLTHGFDYLIKPVADVDLIELLNRLAKKIDYTPPEIERNTQSKKLDGITHYLKEYSGMNHTLESVAERFGIAPNTICNLFQKHLQTTFSAYLNSLRMERAEKLLLTTEKPIKEIAINSGYSDYFYFCRVFRRTHGMSPTRFREAGNGKIRTQGSQRG